MPSYYLDGPSLALATAVYTDPTLTICASDGVYSDGSITRVQTSCVLGSPKFCPSCGTACDFEKDLGYCKENLSVLNVDIDLGNDPGDTGVVIVKFNPDKKPQGLIATYDGVTYNTFSSPIYGLMTAPSGLPAYMGQISEDCGIVTGSPHVLPVYEYNGITYNTTGTTEVVNIFPSQNQLTVNPPGDCIMVIPKTGLNPSQLSISVKAPCGDCFKLSVSCPTVLFPTYTSQVAPTEELVCEYDDNLIYYNYPVSGNGVTLGLFDWIFLDANGEILAADGYYHAPTMLPGAYDWFLVQSGIIIQMGQCAYNAYVITRCADGFSLVADSGVGPITIGQFVTISDPLYAACVWEVTNQTFITPTVTINSISGVGSCSDVCVLYSVDNMTGSDVTVDYLNCDGDPVLYTVAAYTIEYICAKVGSIVVPGSPAGVIVSLDSCDCGF
jgi:hypothetical protein